MKKGWKVVGIIVFVALLLGIVFFAVGCMTGADYDRIYSVLDARYYITEYAEYASQIVSIVFQEFAPTQFSSTVIVTP